MSNKIDNVTAFKVVSDFAKRLDTRPQLIMNLLGELDWALAAAKIIKFQCEEATYSMGGNN
jgi:hypothetical protein